jgi:hypothetical protein
MGDDLKRETTTALTEQTKGVFKTAADAVSYNRIMGVGFLCLIAFLMLLSACIYWFPIADNDKIASVIIDFFKMSGSALIGALCQSTRGNDKGGGQ